MTVSAAQNSRIRESMTQFGHSSDIVAFLGLVSIAYFYGKPNAVWTFGLALAVFGFGLWMTARIQLGRSFSIQAKATQLITHGFYRWLRHPIYLFGGIAHFGAFLAFQNWLVLTVWLLYIVPIQLARLKKEDAILEEAFGEAFRVHRKLTWF